MQDKKIKTIKEAQQLVKEFAQRNNWKDFPNIDKFDHLHEELIEMSQHLRYKNEKERMETIKEKKRDICRWNGGFIFCYVQTCKSA